MRTMVGQDDVERSVQAGPCQARPEFFRHCRGRLDAGQACAHDDDRIQPWRLGSAGKRLKMGVEPRPTIISIHVEGILSETGEVRVVELVAKGEDEPIVRKSYLPACCCHRDG